MNLAFAKMHGLGNDFVVIDEREHAYELSPQTLAAIADRRTGIGCDQILFLLPADDASAAARYRVANADGSEAEHCGNGIRCIAVYLRRAGEITDSVSIEIGDETYELTIDSDGAVSVDMGMPRFEPKQIPLSRSAYAERYEAEFACGPLSFGAVSMGNPHAVIQVDDVETAAVAPIGTAVQASELFPQGVNVGFMQIVSPDHIRLRVCERGVGETRACGTGACAAMAIGRRWGVLGDRATVELTGGELAIAWPDNQTKRMTMTGPATFVFEGSIEL